MTRNEQKKFIGYCIDFQQSCNANGVPCEVLINNRYATIMVRPLVKFEDHFQYDLNDSLELLTESLKSDIEYVIEEHYNLTPVK